MTILAQDVPRVSELGPIEPKRLLDRAEDTDCAGMEEKPFEIFEAQVVLVQEFHYCWAELLLRHAMHVLAQNQSHAMILDIQARMSLGIAPEMFAKDLYADKRPMRYLSGFAKKHACSAVAE
jgi:hypothetical protein